MPMDRIPTPHARNGVYWFNWATTDQGGAKTGRDGAGTPNPDREGDGPPIPDATRHRVVSDVAECLRRGLWQLAARVVEHARGKLVLRRELLDQQQPDGPRLREADARHVAACVDAHLVGSRVATAVRIIRGAKECGDWSDDAEPVTRDSPIAALGIEQYQIDRLEDYRVPILFVGQLADWLDLWRNGNEFPPRRIGQAEQHELMLALERVGLLGPECVKYLAANRTKRDDFKKRRK